MDKLRIWFFGIIDNNKNAGLISIFPALMAFLLGVSASDYVKKSLDLSVPQRISIFILLFMAIVEAERSICRSRRHFSIRAPLTILALFVAYFAFWYERSFGPFDSGSVIFHFRHGFGDHVDQKALKHAARHAALFVVLSLSVLYVFSRYGIKRRIDVFLASLVFAMTPVGSLAAGYVNSFFVEAVLMQEYRQIKNLAKSPLSQQKNLIIIYAESTERTFQHLRHGEYVFADMKWLASQGQEVSGILQVANTGWSVAGLVASQCGVPLQPHKTFYRDRFVSRDSFLKNSTCLGDLLKNHGYRLTYMSGADLSFAGTERFLKEHGYNDVIELRTLQIEDREYLNVWGLYDDTLFELVENKLDELISDNEPFVLSIATIGGHSPDGHPTRKCIEKFHDTKLPSILLAVKCTGFHIRQFIEKARAKGWLENTVVAVMSDHLVMKTAVSYELNQHERMNYFSFLGDGIEPAYIKKRSAMFDVFPTLLELAGFEIKDRRAGLGASLLSDTQTLVERYGADDLNVMITYDTELSAFLWESEMPPKH